MKEKASFLEGFIKGLSIDSNSDYSKAIKEIVSCISKISEEFDDLNQRVNFLEEEICDMREMLNVCCCDCDCDNNYCCKVKCEKCGHENNFTHEKIKNHNCNYKCENCGFGLKIGNYNCKN